MLLLRWKLRPIWFTEIERVVNGTFLVETGRQRKAISHLVCENCLKKAPIDDSYDGEWHYA